MLVKPVSKLKVKDDRDADGVAVIMMSSKKRRAAIIAHCWCVVAQRPVHLRVFETCSWGKYFASTWRDLVHAAEGGYCCACPAPWRAHHPRASALAAAYSCRGRWRRSGPFITARASAFSKMRLRSSAAFTE